MLSQLKFTILAFSAILFASTATQAMETDEKTYCQGQHKVASITTFKDLKETLSLKAGDLVLVNIGHGLVRSFLGVRAAKVGDSESRGNTEESLLANHKTFLESIYNPADFKAVNERIVLGSGRELVMPSEHGLPDLINGLCLDRIHVMPITSRDDDRTEKELADLGYKYTEWLMPSPFDQPDYTQEISSKEPHIKDAYKFRAGIIYSQPKTKPKTDVTHKSVAIRGVVEMLKESGTLPPNIYFIDRDKVINQVAGDLKDVDLGVPLHLWGFI